MNSDATPYLAGKLLIAMPGMSDARFHKAIVFVVAHDAEGAMGLVVNAPLPGISFQDLIQKIKVTDPFRKELSDLHLPVLSGGPVETMRGYLLHSGDFSLRDTIHVGGQKKSDERYGVSGTIEALRAIAAGRGPRHKIFMLGHAGWGAGQLDEEIRNNVWLTAEADPDILFHASAEEKWALAIQTLGVDPAMLSGEAGSA